MERKGSTSGSGRFRRTDSTEDNRRSPTPKWWKPAIPPETYLWEEVRRKRQKGGYPWTLLGKNEGDDDENLYEPVNPPPLYGDEYRKPKEHDTASLDERMIDIPPEIDIITSDGLDGLDKPDPHDRGIDGDREWKSFNTDREDALYPKTSFTAGIRNQELPTHGETSSVRPLTNKSISFAPDVPPDDEEPTTGADAAEAAQQVPVAHTSEVPPKADEEGEEAVPSTSKPSALQQLKAKAGAMKQKFNKISIPVKPKFNQWTNMKLTKGRGKPKPTQGDVSEGPTADQKVPEQGGGGWTEPLSLVPEPDRPADAKMDIDPVEEYVNPNDPFDQFFAKQETSQPDAEAAKKKAAEELKKLKALDKEQRQKEQEELKRLKAEEKLQKQKQAEEEKLQKQKQAEEEKLQKQKQAEEEKLRKEQEKLEREKQQEEERRAKAEEKAQKEQDQEQVRQQQEQEKLLLLQQQLQDYEEFENPPPVQQEQVQNQAAPQRQPEEPPAPEKTAFKDTVASFFGTSSASKPSVDEPKTPEKKRKLPSFELPKFKRSKTPPSRGDQPSTSRFPWKGRSGPAENQLANQYKRELEDREAESTPEPQTTLREPQILITQPSIESGSMDSSSIQGTSSSYPSYKLLEGVPEGGDADDADTSSMSERQRKYKENLDKFKRNLNTFGNRSKAIAAKTGRGMKTFGRGVKNFGVNAVQEVKAKQEAVRQRDAQKRAELAEAQEGGDYYQPANNNQKTIKFRFARRDNKHHSPRPVPAEPVADEPTQDFEEEQGPPKAPRQPPRPRLSSRDSPKSYPVHERKNRKPPPGGDGADDMDDKFLHRSQVLGRADRDWESPLDLARSRDQSEEPWGTASSRDSPPGSSMASSSIMNRAGRHGVLEEIDSDEFFLRERGISEGEDEEEVNRLLVEELRQAFRPTLRNALDDFDIQPSSTSSPRAAPKKPPRKAPEVGNNFQTFPPERPKRSRRAPGYVSAYINENPEEADMMDDMLESHEDNMEIIGAVPEDDDDLEIDMRIGEDDEGIRRVKEELRKLDEALGDDDDDGKYELVSDHPSKPERHKRKKIKHPPTPQAFYYNTIAANEWMRDLEDQVLPPGGDEVPELEPLPVAPRRGNKSRSENHEPQDEQDQDIPMEDEDKFGGGGDSSVHSSRFDNRDFDEEDELAFMDEPGYAVVVRRVTPGPSTDDVPKSLPRKKKQKRPTSKGNSLKRQQQPPTSSDQQLPSSSELGGNAFFSLPRFTPRTFHIVPPTRPHRNYSTLGPRRPPRDKKTKSKRGQLQPTDSIPAGPSQQLQRPVTPLTPAASPASARSGSRPGSSMQGRPLPPPPRPERPAPLNNLDQATLERQALKGRHYANFDDEDLDDFEVHEELVIAKNISLLMDSDSALGSNNRVATSTSDINVAVQTDPLNEDEFELNIHDIAAFEDALDRTDNKYSPRQPSDDASNRPVPPRPPPPTIQNVPQPQQPIVIQPPEIVFPTRLHLDELQVDVLRVNNLTAGSLSLTQIIAPRLELNSISSRGNLSVASITTPNLAVDQVDCSRVTAESADFPSIPSECFTSLLTDIRDAAASSSPGTDSSNQHPSPDKLEILREEQNRLSAQQQGDSAPESKKETTSTSAETPAVPTISTPAPRTVVRRTPSLRPFPSQGSTAGDPDLEDIAQSGLRLGRALMRVTVRTLQAVSEYVETATSNDPEVREKQRTNMKVLMCILMMFIVGILLVARSSSSEPRWQYLLPPQDM